MMALPMACAWLATPAAAQDAVVRAGFALMNDAQLGNCAGCHRWPAPAGQAALEGASSSFGPDLAGVGRRYGAEQLRQWVTDARVLRPDTLMPPFGTVQGLNRPQPARPMLNAEQIAQVVAALQSLR